MRRVLVLIGLASLACVLGPKSPPDSESPVDTGPAPDPPGERVLLYVGNGGGAYDIDAGALAALYADLGVQADISETLPPALADDYGLLLVLSPMEGFPASGPAAALLDRGGVVVVAVEHGGYGDAAGASAWLGALGSTLRALGGSHGGQDDLSVSAVPGLTEGVSALHLFYYGDIDPGDGVVLGTRPDGEPGIGWEAVGAGGVLLVPDGSFFGYSLDEADNRRLLENLAP